MKVLKWMQKFRPISSNPIGWICFQIGVFCLPSSAFISGIFLLIAAVFGSVKRSNSYLDDRWNYPFLAAGILMFFGSFGAYSGWLAWVGLANWLPFFWSFWAFQPYLETTESRRCTALWLVAGTVPVLITGFGQLWWGWHGPWELFNGLIVWFLAPGGQPLGRLSGLFDYANIAGAWLALVWPFCLAVTLQPFQERLHRCIALILAVSIAAAIVLTDSRNAWGGLVLTIPFVLGPTRWKWFLPLFTFSLIPLGLAVFPGVDFDLQQWARKFVPENIWSRLTDIKYADQRYLVTTRLFQWEEAIKIVFERPWLGWGAAAFSLIYPLRNGAWLGHAHNFPLEIAVSHGWPVMLLIVIVVLALLITALRRSILTSSHKSHHCSGVTIFDRSWWTATFVLVSLHSVDMPLFDSRLNVIGWILLAGLRCMIISLDSKKHDQSRLVVGVG